MDKYNGYSNWETWSVNLWLNNDEGFHNATKGMQAVQLSDWVFTQFKATGTFGDIDKITELEKVNFDEIVEANSHD